MKKLGKDGWRSLQEPNCNMSDSFMYYMGWKRGRVSHGCITVDKSAQDQYDALTNLIRREAGENVLTVAP